jgi:hypothetical protein
MGTQMITKMDYGELTLYSYSAGTITQKEKQHENTVVEFLPSRFYFCGLSRVIIQSGQTEIL